MRTYLIRVPLLTLVLAALACDALGGSQPGPTPTSAPARTAEIAEVDNDVQARDAEDAAWQTATLGEQIKVGGGVKTGDDARARLNLSDQTIIRLAANTEFVLETLSPLATDPVTQLKLAAGKMWVQVTQALGGGSFEIDTPQGAATVRGSFMSAGYDSAEGRLVVTCLDGQCRLAGASGAFTDLTRGQQSEIPAPGQNPTPAHPMDPAELADWAREVPEAAGLVGLITPGAPATAEATPTPTGVPPAPTGLNVSNTGKADTPRLRFDAQGTLHLVWFDTGARASGEYLHSQKAASGDWSKAESLTADFGFLYGSLALMRGPGGQMCVLFNAAASSAQPETIGLYRRCQDGATWSPAEKLNITERGGVTQRDFSAVLAADGSVQAAYVVGAGTVFFDSTQLSDEVTSAGPALAVDRAGGYHVVWVRLGTTFDVEYRYSTDSGGTWGAAQSVSGDQNAPDSLTLSLVADEAGNVHLLWHGNNGINYRRWTPGGGWAETASLAGDESGPNPFLALDAQGLARVAWGRFDGVRYVAQSAAGTWSVPRVLSGTDGDQPQIAVDAQGVSHVVWVTNKDVYYSAVP